MIFLLCRWCIVSMTRSMAWSNCFCVNGLTFLFSHFTGDIGSQQAGHADIQQDDVEIFPFFHGVYKVHGVVIGVYLDIRGFVLVISLYGCFHNSQLVL